MEDYLEAISNLQKSHKLARVKDIAAMVNVTMPSVTKALKGLRERKLVDYEKNSFIGLTPKGAAVAERITARHSILVEFLTRTLLLPEEKSEAMACELEHAVDADTIERLRRLVDQIESHFDRKRWVELIDGDGLDLPPSP